MVERGGLLQHVLARQLLAAAAQHELDALRRHVARDGAGVLGVVAGRPGRHEPVVFDDLGVLGEGGIAGILQELRGDQPDRLLDPGRPDHAFDGAARLADEEERPPVELEGLADRQRGEFGRDERQEGVGARGFERDHLRIDLRIGELVARLGHDHAAGLGAQPLLQRLEVVLAEIVVLEEHGDPGIGLGLQDVLGIDPRLHLEAGVPGHRPGEILRIVEAGGAGRDEELRHLLAVEVLLAGEVGRRAERAGLGQDADILDQLAARLDRLGRREAVVERGHLDLAAGDAALGVQHLEIGDLHPADHAEGRGRPAVGNALAELDLAVADAGAPGLVGGCGDAGGQQQAERERDRVPRHRLPPLSFFNKTNSRRGRYAGTSPA